MFVSPARPEQQEKPILTNGIKIFVLLFFCLPFAILLLQSFSAGWQWPRLLPGTFSWRAWQSLFREPRMIPAISITLLIGLAVSLINLILGIPAGKGLAHYRFRGKSLVEAVFLLPLLIPTLAVVMGIHIFMIRVGLTNTVWGVILVHVIPTLPYTIRIFRHAFENLGSKWEEQAATLGASQLTIYRTVWLPLLIPSIHSALMLSFVISLSQYALTAIIGGGNVVTLAMVYFPYFQSSNRSVLACFTVIFALLPLSFYLLMYSLYKLFIRGPGHYRGC